MKAAGRLWDYDYFSLRHRPPLPVSSLPGDVPMAENAPARVLDVGQCAPDHSGIASAIEQNFDAQVDAADSVGEALNLIRQQRYDLVLVNRVIFNDGQDGLELLRIAKREELSTPVMLVSNY